jgi:hypothetical protein
MIKQAFEFVARCRLGPVLVGLLGVVITLPSINVGLLVDDYGMYLSVQPKFVTLAGESRKSRPLVAAGEQEPSGTRWSESVRVCR